MEFCVFPSNTRVSVPLLFQSQLPSSPWASVLSLFVSFSFQYQGFSSFTFTFSASSTQASVLSLRLIFLPVPRFQFSHRSSFSLLAAPRLQFSHCSSFSFLAAPRLQCLHSSSLSFLPAPELQPSSPGSKYSTLCWSSHLKVMLCGQEMPPGPGNCTTSVPSRENGTFSYYHQAAGRVLFNGFPRRFPTHSICQ